MLSLFGGFYFLRHLRLYSWYSYHAELVMSIAGIAGSMVEKSKNPLLQCLGILQYSKNLTDQLVASFALCFGYPLFLGLEP